MEVEEEVEEVADRVVDTKEDMVVVVDTDIGIDILYYL